MIVQAARGQPFLVLTLRENVTHCENVHKQ